MKRKATLLKALIPMALGCYSLQSSESADPRLLHVPSPDWRDQVIYMIMTDRFADGDPSNNDLGYGEYKKGSGSHYNGGDLRGIIDKLPYLKELGVTAIWITPPVLNQWWSSPYQTAGWHGYWAVDFSKVDPHLGTLEDYKDLSHALHSDGMYLIQDIVTNHVGNFYTYDGAYDPDDTAKGFRLLEPESVQPAPTQHPFDLIDRTHPEHAAAHIYHWTPTVKDFSDPEQLTTYMLGFLADINTANPLVMETFKESYARWIKEVGVDGFRIDTVMHVDHAFWHHFLNDPDGIHNVAASLGKEAFLSFGESFKISPPFEASGETQVTSYLGTPEKPGLKSMLAFPLYATITRVFGEGKPTAELEHRLEAFMSHFPQPHIVPTFIDNHDTRRFLGIGSTEGFEQALVALFTLPGIPTLLQGTEQALKDTRQALFAGGYGSQVDHFRTDTPAFQLVSTLSRLRTAEPILTQGDLEVLVADPSGPGLVAYKRTLGEEAVLVIFNTANHSIWADAIPTGLPATTKLQTQFARRFEGEVITGVDGHLSLELPARSALVLGTEGAQDVAAPAETPASPPEIHVSTEIHSRTLSSDTRVTGTVTKAHTRLALILDGNLDEAIPFNADADGAWKVTLPVRDLGETSHYFQIFAPDEQTASARIPYRTHVTETEFEGSLSDPAHDDSGPTGKTTSPTAYEDLGQKDILSVSYKAGGSNLELILQMRCITQDWVPFNGIEKVAFSIFIDLPDQPGLRDLPLLNAHMPEGHEWNLGHILSGWGNSVFTAEGSTSTERGDNTGFAPQVTADPEKGTLTIQYTGKHLGVSSWKGAAFYITTWDVNGEGYYIPINPDPSKFEFLGTSADDPKIMDDALLKLPDKTTHGYLHCIPSFPSEEAEPRPVYVWVPDQIEPGQRYPVVYMHDGQALFHIEDNWNGKTWDVDEVAHHLISKGELPPFIVVGVWNTGVYRHADYFPQKAWDLIPESFNAAIIENLETGNKARYRDSLPRSDAYLRFLVKELKPYVDARFPTLQGPRYTSVMGSSMGGLISMYAICEYPEVFGAAACLSTHWIGKWDDTDNPIPNALLDYMRSHLPGPHSHRLYFDHGTTGIDALYPLHQERVDALMSARGFTPQNWVTRVFDGAGHDETDWNNRLRIPLTFLIRTP